MNTDNNIPDDLASYQIELAEILESNLANKDLHVERLQQYYVEDATAISESYELWQELNSVDVPQMSAEMDSTFYKMLSSVAEPSPKGVSSSEEKKNSIIKLFSPRRLAIAATFLIGMLAGNWLDIGKNIEVHEPMIIEESDMQVGFASLEHTPSASARIKGINNVQLQEHPDLRIIDALYQVILHDPNVNVRLSAIETMVFFSDIPEARAHLIEAIPHQESPMVQLELADVMIALEEESSVDKWNQLLQSDKTDTETRIHLKESLRKIL